MRRINTYIVKEWYLNAPCIMQNNQRNGQQIIYNASCQREKVGKKKKSKKIGGIKALIIKERHEIVANSRQSKP